MALDFTQEQAYVSRAASFRTSYPVDAGSVGQADSWELVNAGFPCAYDYTQNDSDASGGAGRIKRRSALTEDNLFCEASIDVNDQDLTLDITPGDDENRGTFHRVEGQPTILPNQPPFMNNERKLKLMQLEKPPAAVISLAQAAGLL